MNWWQWGSLLWGHPVIVRAGGFEILARTPLDIWTVKETIIDDCYRSRSALKRAKVVVDIGAAMGDFTILAARWANRVIAYECDADRSALLSYNLWHSHKNAVNFRAKAAKSLKQVLRGISTCDFFKIDCEGCEYEVLGKATLVDLAKIRRLAMEVHFFTDAMSSAFPGLVTKLKQAGFRLKIVPNPVHNTIAYVYASRVGMGKRRR